MKPDENTPEFRTALELAKQDDAFRFCTACEDWTPHVQEDDGNYSCLECPTRAAPDCDECDREAAAIVDGCPLCGDHALAEEDS